MAQKNPTHISLLSPKCVTFPPESNENANADNVAGLTRFGINPFGTFGISFPYRRKIAKSYQKNQSLALKLYEIRIHEERISAAMLANLQQVKQEQIDSWAGSFDSWNVCDRVFMNLLDNTAYTYAKAIDWSKREETFVVQAVFSPKTNLAYREKDTTRKQFESSPSILLRKSIDERNFVKKSGNRALCQIGKCNRHLHLRAVSIAREMNTLNSRAAHRNSKDTFRELTQKFFPQKEIADD